MSSSRGHSTSHCHSLKITFPIILFLDYWSVIAFTCVLLPHQSHPILSLVFTLIHCLDRHLAMELGLPTSPPCAVIMVATPLFSVLPCPESHPKMAASSESRPKMAASSESHPKMAASSESHPKMAITQEPPAVMDVKPQSSVYAEEPLKSAISVFVTFLAVVPTSEFGLPHHCQEDCLWTFCWSSHGRGGRLCHYHICILISQQKMCGQCYNSSIIEYVHCTQFQMLNFYYFAHLDHTASTNNNPANQSLANHFMHVTTKKTPSLRFCCFQFIQQQVEESQKSAEPGSLKLLSFLSFDFFFQCMISVIWKMRTELWNSVKNLKHDMKCHEMQIASWQSIKIK